MKHVMMDLETWGTKPGAALRSIGAVVFDPLDQTLCEAEFYANISKQSCVSVGMHTDVSTVSWWLDQGPEAEQKLIDNQRPIGEVVREFNGWFRASGGKYIWSHGSVFDVVLWEAACDKCGEKQPWKFADIRDTRTIFDATGVTLRSLPRGGVHHFALDDARHQARCVQMAFRQL